MSEIVLAVVAHPDDEVLGAGGTLARHAAHGDQVHTVFLTDGVGARGSDQAAVERRAVAARRAAAILGASEPRFLGFPDNRLDHVDLLEVVQAIESLIVAVSPNVIYTHHHGDLNIDHECCQRAVLTACRPIADASLRAIYAMEIASSTEWATPIAQSTFLPVRYVDISATLALKRRALEAYSEEMRAFPHPRSIEALEALAAWRGASGGLRAAEAFSVVREIER